jgi:hypothetical protein
MSTTGFKTFIIYSKVMYSSVSWHTDKNHKNKAPEYPLICLRSERRYFRFKTGNVTGKIVSYIFVGWN